MTTPSTSALTPTTANGEGDVIWETRAKQGRRGNHVLIILIISLIMAPGAFRVIFATHARTTNDATPAAVQASSQTP